MRPRIFFLTQSTLPALTNDDLLAAGVLRERGVVVEPWVWERPLGGERATGAVVRSCWDYHTKPEGFVAALDAIVAAGVPVLNSPSLVRWNIDKSYLKELGRIPKTSWVARGTATPLSRILDEAGFTAAVVKPRVSLSALDTFRVCPKDVHEHETRFRELVRTRDLMVQAFVPEILEGEVSLVFLGGRFSHAVRKTPKAGDFRVQEEHGGTRRRIDPKPEWVSEAEKVLGRLPPMVYARVDVVDTKDGLMWMELEATDPELFFLLAPEAAPRFADAVLAALTETPRGSARG